MHKEKYQKTIRALGILALAFVVFVVGAYAGTQKTIAKILEPAAFTNAQSLSGVSSTAPSNENLSEFWYVWNLMNQKYSFTTTAPTDQDKIYGAISGMVSSYKDPYTEFFPPQEAQLFNDQVTGSFGGVGLEVGMQDGLITVIAPLKGSPADAAGLKSRDIITAINGQKTSLMNLDTAISLIRGNVGTQVTLTVLRGGSSDPLHFTITRKVVSLPTIDTATKGDVFVISLYSFTQDSANLFKGALQKFIDSGKKKLIIDLRDNPGGYLDDAVDIASYFLPVGQTVVKEDSGGAIPEVVDSSKGFTLLSANPQMVVLINGGSASASEILSGALSEHGVAKIVGTQSYGKGSVQQVMNLPDGAAVKITVAKWLTPNGISISQKGITPDVVVDESGAVKDPKTGIYSDPQMEAAIKLLDK